MHPNLPVVLAGLKSDLEGERAVDEKTCIEKAKDIGAAHYIECSARLGTNVDLLFEEAARVHIEAEKRKNKVKAKSCCAIL